MSDARSKCPGCGHVVYQQMVRCLFCGQSLSDSSKMPSRECPRCRRGMAVVTSAWVVIDRCDRCRGEFYDMGEIDPKLDLSATDRRWVEEHRERVKPDTPSGQPLTCPGCRKPMQTWAVPGPEPVTIDVCGACHGTWVDAGEIEKLKIDARAHIVPKELGEDDPPPRAARAAKAGAAAVDDAPPAPAEPHGPVESVLGAIKEIVDILRGKA